MILMTFENVLLASLWTSELAWREINLKSSVSNRRGNPSSVSESHIVQGEK